MDYSDFLQYTEKVPRGSMILAPGYDNVNAEIFAGNAIGLFMLCFVVSTIIGVTIAILIINKDDDSNDVDSPFNPYHDESHAGDDESINVIINSKNEKNNADNDADGFINAVNSHGSIR